MTTIAWRANVLAADRMGCQNNLQTGTLDKIFTYSEGVYAIVGRYSAGLALARRLESVRSNGYEGAFSGISGLELEGTLIVFPDHGSSAPWLTRPFVIVDGAMEPLANAEFYAWGTGGDFALGALAAGASAEKAVELAATLDVYTGGGVTSLQTGRTRA